MGQCRSALQSLKGASEFGLEGGGEGVRKLIIQPQFSLESFPLLPFSFHLFSRKRDYKSGPACTNGTRLSRLSVGLVPMISCAVHNLVLHTVLPQALALVGLL